MNHLIIFKNLIAVTATSILFFLAGCAAEPPKEALVKAETAVQNADRQGAGQYEPELLSSARNKLSNAQKEVEQEDMLKARRLAEEAQAEAVLAAAKADAAKQAQETSEMKNTIEALKQETTYSSEGR